MKNSTKQNAPKDCIPKLYKSVLLLPFTVSYAVHSFTLEQCALPSRQAFTHSERCEKIVFSKMARTAARAGRFKPHQRSKEVLIGPSHCGTCHNLPPYMRDTDRMNPTHVPFLTNHRIPLLSATLRTPKSSQTRAGRRK